MNYKIPASKSDYLSLLALLAMVLWFNYEMIWDGKIPFFRDLVTYFYPMRFILAESFKAGELPLWDRSMGMGFPLLADFQSGTFYPPHLFYWLLPFLTAIKTIFLFHYVVAAGGTYILLRWWHYPCYLSIAGALLFSLGGAVVSLTNLLNHFQAAVWLPWVLLMGERLFLNYSWKNFLLLALVLVLQFLAGSPEFYAMSMALLCLDGLRVRTEKENITRRRVFYIVAAANVLVVGISMVQILPTAELFLGSRGHQSIVYPEAVMWSLDPLSLINLFFLDKEIDLSLHNGIELFIVRTIPYFVSHYMGAVSLIGISLWFFYGIRKEKGVLLGLIIVSFVITLGNNTPIYPFLFQHLPFFGVIRFPEKFFFLSYSLLLFIALRGTYEFLEAHHPFTKGPIIILSLISILMIIPYLFIRFETESFVRIMELGTLATSSTSMITNVSGILLSLERQIALTLAILLLLTLRVLGQIRASLIRILIVGLVFFDLTSAHQSYQFLLNPNFMDNNKRVIKAPSPEKERIFYYPPGPNLHPSYFLIKRESYLKKPSFAETRALIFSNLFPNAGVFHGFEYMQEIDALGRWPYRAFLSVANNISPDRRFRLLGRLNVRHIIALQPLNHEGVTLVRHFPEHPSWLYRIEHIIPRAYIASKVIAEGNPEKILERLSSKEFDPMNEVMLERPLSVSAKGDIQAKTEIVSYANSRVKIRATLDSPGVLVLADSFYPGWHVYVNGEKREILRANLFFRGVPLSAGDHVVEFRYEPLSFTIGLVISLITLIGLILGTVLFSVVGRKKSAPRV